MAKLEPYRDAPRHAFNPTQSLHHAFSIDIELLGIAGFVQSSELSTAQVPTHQLCELFTILRDVTWLYSCV